MIEEFSNYVMIALMALGGLAFTVSVITQVIKGTTLLKKIPTDIIVIVISIALTVTTYFIIADYYSIPTIWYGVVAAVVSGFFVAFIATYGWTKFHDLWLRFKK